MLMGMTQHVRKVVGCMTGTSLDGLDAVLTRIEGVGLDMRASFERMVSRPLGNCREMLRSLAQAQPHPAEHFVRAARELGQLHAETIGELIGDDPIDFVVAHGQTIYHAGDAHLSWQLFDPWPIVRRLKVPVCYDMRQADLIAGGEGAPIATVADQIIFADRAALVINLGGIVNATIFSGDLEGKDFGPCNLLIDQVVAMVLPGERFDRDGQFSQAGRADENVFEPLMKTLPFYNELCRSLGREDFTEPVIRPLVEHAQARLSAHDIVASAVESVADLVATVIAWYGGGKTVLAGGGARNRTLVERINAKCRVFAKIKLCDDLGIPCEAREGMAFAVLGALSQDRVPITFPSITSADNPGIAGAWVYP